MFEIAGGIILAVLILAVAPIVIGLVVEGIGIVGWILWKIGPWILAAIAVYVIVAALFPISPWLGAGGLVAGVLIAWYVLRERKRILNGEGEAPISLPSPTPPLPVLTLEELQRKRRSERRADLRKRYADRFTPSDPQ